MRAFAEKLVVFELKRTSRSRAESTLEVLIGIRSALSKLAGREGFSALMRRALVLAREEVPGLQQVELHADGSVRGLEELMASAPAGGRDPGIAILAHLLALLVVFIGESLTVRLLREAWPSVHFDLDKDQGMS